MKKIGKNKFIISIIVFIIFCVVVVTLLLLLKKDDKITYQKTINMNVGEEVIKEVTYQKGKKNYKATITWKNLKEEDGKIYFASQYQGTFKIKKKEYPVELAVIDKKAPTIENVKDIEIVENEEIDLLKNIKTTDDSHDKVEITVVGEYDKTKPGEYELQYEAKDKSGNVKTEKFKLTVKEKKKNISTTKPEGNTITAPTGVISKGTTSKGYKIELKNGLYYIDGILIANKTYALPSTYAPGGLLPELNTAFAQMKADALAAGLNINIVSGYRSYSTQNRIYNNYVNRDGVQMADTYSARPGHSEHQTGLAVDVNSLLVSFKDTPEGIWLTNNCYKYGFILRYPEGKDGITGYMYEPWHFRYVGVDVASKLYNNGNWITLEEYLGIDSQYGS